MIYKYISYILKYMFTEFRLESVGFATFYIWFDAKF